MKRTEAAHSESADLVFDVQGSGEPLLLIPGAGGDAWVYGPRAALLSDTYEVITYDRRCNSRSSGDTGAPFDMAQQARDAVAVLRATGHPKALVFGNSGGANIALQLAADHPSHVALLAAHEAPALGLLVDEADTMAFVQQAIARPRRRELRRRCGCSPVGWPGSARRHARLGRLALPRTAPRAVRQVAWGRPKT